MNTMMQSTQPSLCHAHLLHTRCSAFGRVHKPFVSVQHIKARSAAAGGARQYFGTSCRAQATEIILKGDDGGSPLVETWDIEEGIELVSMPFSRPLGAVLAEQNGRVVVERIKDGSNAAIGGLQIGDVIRGTTARSKEDVKDTEPGSDARAKQDYFGALVLLNADGQKFDTVMAAINSSKCASCDVTLVVERQKGAPSKASPQSPAGKTYSQAKQ